MDAPLPVMSGFSGTGSVQQVRPAGNALTSRQPDHPPTTGFAGEPRDEPAGDPRTDSSPKSHSSPTANPTATASPDSERQRELDEAQLAEIRELVARDREVRAHERAHAAAGGQYAGSPVYSFQRGPDGVSYAVGGEVSIDTSKEATPEATLNKAEVIRRAALAPAEPSPQDRRVAADAAQMATEARVEIQRERAGPERTENESTKQDVSAAPETVENAHHADDEQSSRDGPRSAAGPDFSNPHRHQITSRLGLYQTVDNLRTGSAPSGLHTLG